MSLQSSAGSFLAVLHRKKRMEICRTKLFVLALFSVEEAIGRIRSFFDKNIVLPVHAEYSFRRCWTENIFVNILRLSE